MTKASNIQTVAVLTEHGLIITLHDPDELELAYRWSLNGGPVSFQIRAKKSDEIEDGETK